MLKIPRFARVRRDERGAALLAVVFLMLTTAVIGLTVTAMSVNALGYTSLTRAGVQSQAGAESGVTAVYAALSVTGATCSPTYTNSTAPEYTATLYYSTSTAINSGTVWSSGCPTSAAKFVKIVSVGSAQSDGVAGATSGNTESIEAIYNYAPPASIPATGGAVYNYSGVSNSNLNNLTATQGAGIPANIILKSGDLTCQSTSVINGDIILGNGNYSSSGSCKVTGAVKVSGSATINSGSNVLGDVTASGVGIGLGTPVVSVYGNGPASGDNNAVTGSVFSGGQVTIQGRVGGSVTSMKTATGATPNTSTIAPTTTTRIGGNLTGAGDFTTWATRCTTGQTGYDRPGDACALKASGTVVGTVTYNVAGLTAPTAPTAPGWVDYKYIPSDWTSQGFNIVTWANDGDHCTIDNRTSLLSFALALSTYTTPTLIDATACTQETFSNSAGSGGLNVTLKTDIAFVSNSFSIEGFKLNSNNTTQRKVWFIVSDKTADGAPTCSGGAGPINIGNNSQIGSTVAAIAYTPCQVAYDATAWRGQLYGQSVTFGGGNAISFVPVGLPNVDLSTGTTSTTTTSTRSLGTRVSVRDL
jgi:hypothetical protein